MPQHSTRESSTRVGPLAARIAEVRRERGMSIAQLSRAAGISSSMISQVEREQAVPSVASLYAIARSLGVSPDTFFVDQRADDGDPAGRAAEPRRSPVLRADKRPSVEMASGVRWERLTPVELDDLEFMAIEYAPGATSGEELYRHAGSEVMLVVNGALVAEVAFQRHELGPGDSITFDATQPHRYVNESSEVTHGYVVVLGVTGDSVRLGV